MYGLQFLIYVFVSADLSYFLHEFRECGYVMYKGTINIEEKIIAYGVFIFNSLLDS